MNAREWLDANVGKKIHLVRKFMGNKTRNIPPTPEMDETTEGVLKTVQIGEFGWSFKIVGSGSFCFSKDDLGSAEENAATVECEAGSGNVFRHEFALLE